MRLFDQNIKALYRALKSVFIPNQQAFKAWFRAEFYVRILGDFHLI
jgi:hypothetical protein